MYYEWCQRGGSRGLLKGQAGFLDIYRLIEKAMAAGQVEYKPDLERLLAADKWARDYTRKQLAQI